MGFNLYNKGLVHPCSIVNGNIQWRDSLDGTVHICHAGLDSALQVQEQRNIFRSRRIAFILSDGFYEYVGRFDGTISTIRIRDNLLVGLCSWEVPAEPRVEHVGYYQKFKKMYPILCNTNDRKRLYLQGTRAEMMLDRPLNKGTYNIDLAVKCIKDNCYLNDEFWYIFINQGGSINHETAKGSKWLLQVTSSGQDNR